MSPMSGAVKITKARKARSQRVREPSGKVTMNHPPAQNARPTLAATRIALSSVKAAFAGGTAPYSLMTYAKLINRKGHVTALGRKSTSAPPTPTNTKVTASPTAATTTRSVAAREYRTSGTRRPARATVRSSRVPAGL